MSERFGYEEGKLGCHMWPSVQSIELGSNILRFPNHELAVVIEMQVVEHRASVVRLGTAVRPLSCCTSAPELDGRCYLRLPGRREGHSRWKAVGTGLLC